MRVPYTAKCIGEWAGGYDREFDLSAALIGSTIKAFPLSSMSNQGICVLNNFSVHHQTIYKEFDDLVILAVTFDSRMTSEKHLRSVSRAASQRLGILRK